MLCTKTQCAVLQVFFWLPLVFVFSSFCTRELHGGRGGHTLLSIGPGQVSLFFFNLCYNTTRTSFLIPMWNFCRSSFRRMIFNHSRKVLTCLSFCVSRKWCLCLSFCSNQERYTAPCPFFFSTFLLSLLLTLIESNWSVARNTYPPGRLG